MHSFKFLLGVAPNGAITFCHELFSGSTNDRNIVLRSGILDHFQSGDHILADNPGHILSVNIPPFLHHGRFTPCEVKDVAQNRIHVERANSTLKQFKILNMILSHLRSFANDIVQVCCVLVNF